MSSWQGCSESTHGGAPSGFTRPSTATAGICAGLGSPKPLSRPAVTPTWSGTGTYCTVRNTSATASATSAPICIMSRRPRDAGATAGPKVSQSPHTARSRRSAAMMCVQNGATALPSNTVDHSSRSPHNTNRDPFCGPRFFFMRCYNPFL